ncbi:cytochrome b subunit of succinate dehydrogenase, Sdh3p [Tilletia horrida]|uniref:Cytochrome b subunit of succinate dehydrogenase, Sdh3p n=1 Tax=Tilletia horrida TaxID=155126 RepID=A0AAN6GDJ5_9BASI|nr:cytochrome b subunit of succinate dehydrogenase, Sdh3p [Tilletia horrida]KAK0531224.1 cytochrome b subunit of succinate dehydrogenase, Sdh3p [Tilletia horrida]KAK0532043.1 cytochrome b subunit of succinate dehydrogenase, Sdh3p [Tilletia horrida]KAK0560605.1 cytochrome b subunit of succinate dehydrogenase, Sdh3p [Tilletia horrida]
MSMIGVNTRLLARTFARPQSGALLASRVAAAATASTSAPSPSLASQVSIRASSSKTVSFSQDESLELLNKQRSLRPTSPHLTIYQPQLTWLASIANRGTGVGLSVLMYGWALAYLAGPYVGLDTVFSSAYLVEFASHIPFWLKTTIKAPLALAASFHTWNGFRHLAWDFGYLLSLKGAYASGYAVIAASIASTVGLLMI